MTKILNTFTLIAVIAISSFSAKANTPPSFPFIVVNGQANVDVAPDNAKITFNILSVDKQPKQALETVALRGREMVKLAMKFDIDRTKIKSFSLQKRIIRSNGRNYDKQEITGYEVSQRFALELVDIEHYSALMDSLISMENVNNVQINFDLSSRQALERELVKQAGEDARAKANDIALGLGVKLGNVFAASTDANFSSYLATFGINEAGMRYMETASFKSGQYNMFVPETIAISKTISVVYRLD